QGKFVYNDKELISFVNYDTSVEELLKTNNHFSGNARKEKSINNPYADLLLDIVKQNKEISEWQLENIFVVEFETEYGAYSRIQYFNIKRYVARFFVQYASSMLNIIQDYTYRLQIVDYILKDKDIKYIINDRLREELSKDNSFGFYSYLATKIRITLNLLKKEDIDVEEQIKKNNAKITVLYNLGVEIHEELKAKGESNKLDSYIYKMLNFIRLGNKKELMDTILRIHISMGKEISPIFLDIMKDSTLDYEAVGQSFISGLISYRKKEEVQNNE
ncbi:MAG: type I-B CRISPR-associated protein Cas8b1/Cst1, partial [Clostridia bacterium]